VFTYRVSKKRILLGLVIAAAGAAIAQWLLVARPSAEEPRQARAPASSEQRHSDAAQGWLAVLPKREGIGKLAGQLFLPQSWTPPAPPQASAPSAAPSSAPMAPPMPYRVAGKLLEGGTTQLVLAKGDSIVSVREGQTLDDGYRVEAIGRDEVTLLYLPLGVKQTLPMISSLVIDKPRAEILERSREPLERSDEPEAAPAPQFPTAQAAAKAQLR
jgi:hypothetical protein